MLKEEWLLEWIRSHHPHIYQGEDYKNDWGEIVPGTSLEQIPEAHDPTSDKYHPSPLPCLRCEFEKELEKMENQIG